MTITSKHHVMVPRKPPPDPSDRSQTFWPAIGCVIHAIKLLPVDGSQKFSTLTIELMDPGDRDRISEGRVRLEAIVASSVRVTYFGPEGLIRWIAYPA